MGKQITLLNQIALLMTFAMIALHVLVALFFNQDADTFFLISGLSTVVMISIGWILYFWFGKR